MEYKQSLARRIVIAFMLMTVAVGGLFSAGIVGVVHIIEERLISRDLGGELERILRDDLAQGRNPVLDPGMRFFISDGQGSYAMPPALDQLDVGFHEVFEGDLSFHALVRDIDGRRFVLLQDQSDFEAREQVLYASVLTGYVLSIALAGLLGWMLARKVMEPVVRLARQVRHREQLLGLAPPLAPDYANDEVGELPALPQRRCLRRPVQRATAARGDGQPVTQRDPLHRCREHHADPRRAWFQRRGHRGGRPGRTTRTHLHALRSRQFQLRARRRPWPRALAGEADLRGRGLERNPQRGGAARLPVRSFTRCCLTKNSPPLDPSLTAGFIPFVS